MQISELHRAARRLAQGGTPVFPCLPGTKEPACAHGFHDATTDLAVIDQWWSENPQANIAFCPDRVGLAVVDPDGAAGQNAWANLQIEFGEVPETFTVATPRGGLHVYFRGELPPSQSRLADHVDTRGRGSYALLPPSRIDGYPEPYRTICSAKPIALPAWVKDHPGLKPRERVLAAVEDLDQGANVARASKLLSDYVRRGNVAVEGEMGDLKTYTVACEVVNLGLSPAKAMELIAEIWNPHCLPPWEIEELETKVQNAASYAQNSPGAWGVEPAQVVFGDALDKLIAENPEPARPSRFRAWSLEEMARLKPPTWLVPDMIPDEGLSLFYGPGDSYKTFLVITLGLELAAAGKSVLYLAGEGGVGAYKRINAWRVAHGAEKPLSFRVVREMPWASDGDMLREFIEENRQHRPALAIVDTAARMLVGLNENDARDMGMLVAALDTIQRQLHCAVAAIHHTGKDVAKGARGSDALLYATDAAFEVIADSRVKAAAIHCRRQKDAARRETPWTYEGREIADSLVFQPISFAEHKRLTTADDEITSKKIGAALVALGARGVEAAVTTHVLATQLLEAGLTDDQRAEAAGRLSGLLAKRSGAQLEAYAHGKGASLKWCLP